MWLPCGGGGGGVGVGVYMYVRVRVRACVLHSLFVFALCVPAADKTFCSRSGNEKVRKTNVADAAMLAPSPESLTVTLVSSEFPS